MTTLLKALNLAKAPAEDALSPLVGGSSSSVVLAAHGLRKTFGSQVVLDRVDLELREGEVVLLRGDNGSGKTTLINILTGNVEPDAGTIHYLADRTSREFHFPRRWWQKLNPFDHFTPESTSREGMGRMWQDVRLFNSQTLRDNIAVAAPLNPGENPFRALFSPLRTRKSEIRICEEADAQLGRLGLEGRETSSADKISLGQSKRVAIARAVAAGARILFLDEPLAGLDRQGIANVIAFLESLVAKQRVTLVIIEHVFNLSYLQHLATADWFLLGGKITVTNLPTSTSNSVLAPFSIIPESSTQRPAWFSLLADQGAEIIDEPLPRGALLTRIRGRYAAQAVFTPLLEIKDLVVQRGCREVIGRDNPNSSEGLSFTVNRGEVLVLRAPNGWGKTTLLQTIARIISPVHGSIRFAGANVLSYTCWQVASLGLTLHSAATQCFPSLTVEEWFALAGVSPEKSIEPQLGRRSGELSGGQLALVSLWSSIARKQEMLCLDEPFNALDQSAVATVANWLRNSGPQTLLICMPY